MSFYRSNDTRWYSFDSFDTGKVIQGVFTRLGGVSPDPWKSLNLGGTVGDDRSNVIENRRRIFDALDLPVESLYDVWQIHSTTVVYTTAPRPLDAPHVRADAILTDRPEVTLFMRFADCVPVFLYDPIHHAIALIHAGWKGTVANIAGVTVRRMAEVFHSRCEDLQAAIGPSIGPDHYVVGDEVYQHAKVQFGADTSHFMKPEDGHYRMNLWEANRIALENEGVKQVEISGICTACNIQDWYSHRGENGKTGRFGALFALR